MTLVVGSSPETPIKPTNSFFSHKKQGGVSHTHRGLTIYILKKKYYLKANIEELWKLKYNFTMQK
jgi:hypothetical protein